LAGSLQELQGVAGAGPFEAYVMSAWEAYHSQTDDTRHRLLPQRHEDYGYA
jgi:hypothetical protein